MNVSLAVIEASLAIVLAVVVIIVSPGVAITLLVALVALVACGVTLAGGRLRHRRSGARGRVAARSTFSRRGR